MMTIIRREFLDNLKSTQFIVLFAISLILFAAGTLLSVSSYRQQMRLYADRIIEANEHPSTVSATLYPTPEVLSFISNGDAKSLPTEYTLNPGGSLSPHGDAIENYKLPDLPPLDWSFDIKMVFSLFVILLGYDTIAGERQHGTLRLALSAPIGRAQLLAAKYIAILATVAIPLMCGIVLGLIVAALSLPAVLTTHTLHAAFMMFLVALLYLSVFVLLCLAVSSAVHQSSLALVLLLTVWVVFTIIIPDTAGILAEKATKVPGEYQMAREFEPMIQKQIWAKIADIGGRASRGEFKTEEELLRETDHAFDTGQRELTKYYQDYAHAIRMRAGAARALSRFSPTALFQYASEGLAGTGTGREEQFLRDATEYSTAYDRYILRKVGRVVGVTNWAFGTSMEVNGRYVFVRSPYPEEYQGDKSDFPRFSETPINLFDSFNNALWDSAGLVLWNLVLAALSFTAILRSDVR